MALAGRLRMAMALAGRLRMAMALAGRLRMAAGGMAMAQPRKRNQGVHPSSTHPSPTADGRRPSATKP